MPLLMIMCTSNGHESLIIGEIKLKNIQNTCVYVKISIENEIQGLIGTKHISAEWMRVPSVKFGKSFRERWKREQL